MSVMSDLDLMLKEYEGARAAMLSAAGTTILGHLQAAENVIRAADVLACGLRSILAVKGNDEGAKGSGDGNNTRRGPHR
jgi:hypothetical protein